MTEPMVRIEIPEQQIVEMVSQLSDSAKQQILKRLIIDHESWEPLYAVGESRIQAVCRERGLNWDALSEAERTDVIAQILHEK